MKKKWLKPLLAVMAGALVAGVAPMKIDAGPGQKKVTICHKGQTMEVPEPAVQAHLGHGDTLGPCSITPSKNQ